MFPESLKLADVTPVSKKSDPTLVSNYRPISVLPTAKSIWEVNASSSKWIYRQASFTIFMWLQKGIQYLNCTFVPPWKMEKYIR